MAIQISGDAERSRKIARTPAQSRIVIGVTPLAHRLETFNGFDRSDENRGWETRSVGNNIETPMNTVAPVNVSDSWCTEHRCVARGAAYARGRM
jgi:hypothetical protein